MIDNFQVVHYKNKQVVNDPCTENFVPTISTLLRWQSELVKAQEIAADYFFIEFSFAGLKKRFDLSCVMDAQKLHRARECKQAVEKELSFISSSKSIPRSDKKKLDMNALGTFVSLIHEKPYLDQLEVYLMVPEELARLCSKRYLSDEHMLWISNKLNSMQDDTLCIYSNFISNVERFCEKIKNKSKPLPSKIVMILNIGTSKQGTYIAGNGRSGCHFTLAVYEQDSGHIMYGDSLGWPAPDGILPLLSRYAKGLYGMDGPLFLNECHSSNQTYGGTHRCNNSCKAYYPLQKDGDICGVVCIIIASIVCLATDFWVFMADTGFEDRRKYPYIYLCEPTKYHKYLRSVVMTWFANCFIDIQNVIAANWALADSSDSDGDEEVQRMDEDQINKSSIQENVVKLEPDIVNSEPNCHIYKQKKSIKTFSIVQNVKKHSLEKVI